MRIVKVNEFPVFMAQCIECFKTIWSDQERFYADLDGKPFKAYYCEDCVNKLGRGITIEL